MGDAHKQRQPIAHRESVPRRSADVQNDNRKQDRVPQVAAGVPIENILHSSYNPPELKDIDKVTDRNSLFMIARVKYDDRIRQYGVPPVNTNGYVDKWDDKHVRMPCSPKYVSKNKKPLWETIIQQLLGLRNKCLKNRATFEELILTIDECSGCCYNFHTLETLLKNNYTPHERENFLSYVLPNICMLAVNVHNICTTPPPLLRTGSKQSVTMSQHQAASLLACAFFCLFPYRSENGPFKEYEQFPNPNFNGLYEHGTPDKVEKLKCILHYFERITARMPIGVLTFRRCALEDKDNPQWSTSKTTLCDIHITPDKKIEDINNVLQVDFANKYIGGGVLGNGCVQEEIRFSLCPEMLVSLLICEVLAPNECIFLVGCARYSTYDGYAQTFRFTGDYVDQSVRDSWGRKWVHLVAMDALYFRDRATQYEMKHVKRELTKAFVGFQPRKTKIPEQSLFGIATGHWGCGVFNGDKQLKAIIQLMAASQNERPLIYAAYLDKNFVNSFSEVYNTLQRNRVTVGDLYRCLEKYSTQHTKISLFDFILSIWKPSH